MWGFTERLDVSITPTPADALGDGNPFGEPTTNAYLNHVEAPAPELGGVGFWDFSPQLQRIAYEAAAEDISAWGLLAACMAHRASHVPPTVVLVGGTGQTGTALAAGTSTNGMTCLVGEPGSGKSVTLRVAAGLVPPEDEPLPDGTGQGIVKAFASTKMVTRDEDNKPLKEPYAVTEYHRHSLVVHAPEIETLNAEFARQGSKTGGMLRSLWVGETVGMTNGDKDRNAALHRNLARFEGIWGVQPTAAGMIMAGANVGTPQRFNWLPVKEYRDVVRTLPPAGTIFPYPIFPTHPMGVVLPRTVKKGDPLPDPIWVRWSPQMRADILAAKAALKALDLKREGAYDDLSAEELALKNKLLMDAHMTLTLIKNATKMGWLHGRPEPSDEDWYLSKMLGRVSTAEAAGVWKMSEADNDTDAGKRGKTRAVEMAATDEHRAVIKDKLIAKAANRAWEVLATASGPLREGTLRRQLTAAHRQHIKDVLYRLQDDGRATQDGDFWYAMDKYGQRLINGRAVD